MKSLVGADWLLTLIGGGATVAALATVLVAGAGTYVSSGFGPWIISNPVAGS
jgi:3-phosphoglycerate kinase